MRKLRYAAVALCAAIVVLAGVRFVILKPNHATLAPGLVRELKSPEDREGDRDRDRVRDQKEEGNAWDAFEWWYGTRAFPNDMIPKAAWYQAYEYAKANLAPPQGVLAANPQWTSIGPNNVGGRVLSMAINPSNTQVIWAGAASGGLWKSTTGGDGAAAWTLIDTGFPLVAVSAITIDPRNPNVMYIGTGEMGRYNRGQVGTPGARSSYGIGVIKSTDGGVTWGETGLTWTIDQSRAVFAVKMDPTDSRILWCATSEGLYKSTDSGATWTNSHPSLMAIDVVIDPWNHQRVWVSHGQLNGTPDPGIYRTLDGGATWTQLTNGLPSTNFGRCPLSLYAPSPMTPELIYAGVSDANSRQVVGLYKSTNGGDLWTRVNSTNWASSQAWYDNIVAAHPTNANIVFCGGLDWYRSQNGGSSLGQVSYWYLGYGGVIPPQGPEGPPNYVHADHHALVFDPNNSQIIYIGCDGGVFKSTDGGSNWAGKNGGFVTTQFYAGFAGASTTTALSLGGLQDNGTVKYTGSASWSKVYGGDGGYCAIDPTNENVMYEEYVYCDISKSNDGGNSWYEIHPGDSGNSNFIAPFTLCETRPNVLYAGMKAAQKSTDGGSSWFYPDGNSNWNNTPMAVIGVSYTSPDTVLAGTGSSTTGAIFEIRRSTNGGVNWTNVTAGLPNRFPTDICFERTRSASVWLTFSGYGTPHVFHSTDAGLTWTDQSGNLPDIPVQSVVIDPINSDWVYVGTDLGVYRTLDGGLSWMDMNRGMPPAMVLDLTIKLQGRVMRAATFGNGVYEMNLADPAAVEAAEALTAGIRLAPPSPNPVREGTSIRFSLAKAGPARVGVYDAAGRLVKMLVDGERPAGESQVAWNGHDAGGIRVAHGLYFARLTAQGVSRTQKVTVVR